jgi:hypothetical protein
MAEPIVRHRWHNTLLFDCAFDAKEHRRLHGTGGWIFEQGVMGHAVLFPPEMTPSEIFAHPLTKGISGQLIGASTDGN